MKKLLWADKERKIKYIDGIKTLECAADRQDQLYSIQSAIDGDFARYLAESYMRIADEYERLDMLDFADLNWTKAARIWDSKKGCRDTTMAKKCLSHLHGVEVPTEKILYADLNRPWGEFLQFAQNEPCTTKILIVKGSEMNSLQFHGQRDELWFPWSGKVRAYKGKLCGTVKETEENLETYELEIDNKEIENLKCNNSEKCLEYLERNTLMIPRYFAHRAEGLDSGSMILEVSFGNFEEHEDNVRLIDKYNGRIDEKQMQKYHEVWGKIKSGEINPRDVVIKWQKLA